MQNFIDSLIEKIFGTVYKNFLTTLNCSLAGKWGQSLTKGMCVGVCTHTQYMYMSVKQAFYYIEMGFSIYWMGGEYGIYF